MTMTLRRTATALLVLLLGMASFAANAVDEKDLLPVDQAFAFDAKATSRDAIALTWRIAPGYYLYRHRTKVESADFTGAALQMPPGKHKRDEFFGDVETYRSLLEAKVVGTPASDARSVTLKVKYQGCADVGVCYPPQMRSVQVALPSMAGGLLGAPAPAGPLQFGVAKGEPLPETQAFHIEAIADGGNALLVRFAPAPGYYLYRDKTQLTFEGEGISLRAPEWPPGKQHRDEHFGDVVVYFDPVDVKVPVQRAHARAVEGTLRVTFQGCQDGGICYPLMTRSLPMSLPAGDVSTVAVEDTSSLAEDQRLAQSLGGKHRAWALVLFFAYGLGLAFTPCVLPMVPILSGLIAGRGERVGAWRGFSLSTVYVLASAVVFTIAGILAGLLGAAANLQAAMQNAWVLGAFALLFVVLSLSMFGLYELQLPASLRARLGAASDRQRGGSWVGVAAMGALSALIVGPCVAPPLMGAVLYIAQARDPVFGGAALFLLALGMGAPLVAFGVARGARDADERPVDDRGAARVRLRVPRACDLDVVARVARVVDVGAVGPARAWRGDVGVHARQPAGVRRWPRVSPGSCSRSWVRRSCSVHSRVRTIRCGRSPVCAARSRKRSRSSASSRSKISIANRRRSRGRQAADARLLCRLVRELQGDGEVRLHPAEGARGLARLRAAAGRRHRERRAGPGADAALRHHRSADVAVLPRRAGAPGAAAHRASKRRTSSSNARSAAPRRECRSTKVVLVAIAAGTLGRRRQSADLRPGPALAHRSRPACVELRDAGLRATRCRRAWLSRNAANVCRTCSFAPWMAAASISPRTTPAARFSSTSGPAGAARA